MIRRPFTRTKMRGFTLLELMIVVAIVAILAAIALPSYQQYVQRARRVEATAALYRVSGALEKYFLANNAYTTDISLLRGHGLTNNGSEWVTESGSYRITIPADAATNGWRVRADALGGTPQAGDRDCQMFTLALTGAKSAADSGGVDTTATCWR